MIRPAGIPRTPHASNRDIAMPAPESHSPLFVRDAPPPLPPTASAAADGAWQSTLWYVLIRCSASERVEAETFAGGATSVRVSGEQRCAVCAGGTP